MAASLFGSELLGKGDAKVDTATLAGKYVGIYFSAHWCPPCKMFTPQLIKFYNNHAAAKNFEIVFASSDRSQGEFDSYRGEMPWLSIPLGSKVKDNLSAKYKVRGIPTLVWVGPDGETITTDGRGAVMGDAEAAGFPWKPKTTAELLTDDLEITTAEGTTTLGKIKAGVDYIGLYFSAHWCGPCRGFTPTLSKFYRDHHEGKKFEILFVSSDEDDASFATYFGEMPWKAVPFARRDLKESLSKTFDVEGIPTLVFVEAGGDMKTVSKDARGRVQSQPEDFPWPAKALEPLAIHLGAINDEKVCIVFTDKMTDGDNEEAVKAAVTPVAETYFAARNGGGKEVEGDVLFAIADDADEETAERVRMFLGLADDDEDDEAVRIVVTDIPSGVKYVYKKAGIPTEADVRAFIGGIFSGSESPSGIRDKP
uniref:Thioredoxin domain-containing protein n=1 Tax=Bicosoecida sp. CB-2014 TaxID=1486930 RepID=A0A7S1CIC7_9STRA